jgi:hypothetical protein
MLDDHLIGERIADHLQLVEERVVPTDAGHPPDHCKEALRALPSYHGAGGIK